MLLRSLALILFLNFNQFLFAQSSTPGGSVRITVFGGGSIDFIFNSMSDYNTGITYLNYTRIGITVRDEPGDINAPPGDDYTNWNVTVQVDDADADGFLTGGIPANTIPFSSVEVQATGIFSGCITCNLLGSLWLPLAVAPTIIMDGSLGGADQIEDVPSPENLTYTADQVNISFRCGVTTSLLGATADYYSDDIFFDLTMSP